MLPKLAPCWPQVGSKLAQVGRKLAPSWVMRIILERFWLPDSPPRLSRIPQEPPGTLQGPSRDPQGPSRDPPRDPSGPPRTLSGTKIASKLTKSVPNSFNLAPDEILGIFGPTEPASHQASKRQASQATIMCKPLAISFADKKPCPPVPGNGKKPIPSQSLSKSHKTFPSNRASKALSSSSSSSSTK